MDRHQFGHLHRPDNPPDIRPVQVNDGGTGQQVATGRVRLYGWSLTNSAAAGNTLALWDNDAASGMNVATVPLAASSSAVQMPSGPGVIFEIGLFVKAGAATITGTLFISDDFGPGFGSRGADQEAAREGGNRGDRIPAIPGGTAYGQ